jgi:hypothetical protein
VCVQHHAQLYGTAKYNFSLFLTLFVRSIHKVFDASDVNGDGVVDKGEAYEMVLHM